MSRLFRYPIVAFSSGLGCLPELPSADTSEGTGAPVFSELTIVPDPLFTDDTARVTDVDGTTQIGDWDPESDAVEVTYIWEVANDNGDVWTFEDAELSGMGTFNYQDKVSVQMTATLASDPDVSTVSEQVTVSVANSPPSAPGIELDAIDRCGSIQFT